MRAAISKLAAGALGIALILSACAADSSDDPETVPAEGDEVSDDQQDDAAQGEVDPEGTMTVGFRSPPSQLDPHRSSPPDWHIPYLIYDRLFQVDAQLQVQPMLATDYETSDDGLTLTLRLRDEVTFHDGTPLDADAVKASLERGQTVEGSTVAGDLSSIESIDVVDDQTVELTLSQPDATLLSRLGMVAGSIINPVAIEEERPLDAGDPEAGSGPYVIKEFEAGVSVVLEPSPGDHWDPEAGRLAELEIQTIADNAPRMSGIQTGELDAAVMVQVQADEARSLAEQREDLSFYTFDSPLHFLLYMRNDRSEFDQVEVRQAVAHAIDEEAISQSLLGGECVTATQPYPPSSWAYDESYDGRYEYDLDRARDLLTEAGLEDGFEFEVLVNAGQSPQTEIAEIMQAALAEINVTVNITPMDSAAAVEAFRAGEHDAYMHNVSGLPDPGILTEFLLLEDGPFHLAGDEDAQVADLAAEAADSRLSQEERAERYSELSEVIMENAWYVPVCFQPTAFLMASDVIGVDPLSYAWSWIPDFRYLARTQAGA